MLINKIFRWVSTQPTISGFFEPLGNWKEFSPPGRGKSKLLERLDRGNSDPLGRGKSKPSEIPNREPLNPLPQAASRSAKLRMRITIWLSELRNDSLGWRSMGGKPKSWALAEVENSIEAIDPAKRINFVDVDFNVDFIETPSLSWYWLLGQLLTLYALINFNLSAMRSRQSLLEIFSTFLQFEGDRASKWAIDARLRRNMQHCLQQSDHAETASAKTRRHSMPDWVFSSQSPICKKPAIGRRRRRWRILHWRNIRCPTAFK